MERVKSKAAFFASVYSDVERPLKQIILSDLSPSCCVWLVFVSTLLYNVPKSLSVVFLGDLPFTRRHSLPTSTILPDQL